MLPSSHLGFISVFFLRQEIMLLLQVSWKVYLKYFKAIGGISTFFIFGLFILYNAGGIVSNIWLSQWTDDKLLRNTTLANTTEYQDKNYMYLGVYAALGIGQGNTGIIIIIKNPKYWHRSGFEINSSK